jgi:molybdopterin-binding protein
MGVRQVCWSFNLKEDAMPTSLTNSVSARNQIGGRIAEIQPGTTMTIVTISADGRTSRSAITSQAAQDLGLKKNDAYVAFLVKLTEAIIAKGDAGAMKTSARNKASGTGNQLVKGAAMGSVRAACS